jgi:hypothetical protein
VEGGLLPLLGKRLRMDAQQLRTEDRLVWVLERKFFWKEQRVRTLIIPIKKENFFVKSLTQSHNYDNI